MLILGAIGYEYLTRPIAYDEALTHGTSISPGYWNIVSEYPMPNNHVLHNVLARLSLDLLGDDEAALRLPALLAAAGMLIVTGWMGWDGFPRGAGVLAMLFLVSDGFILNYAVLARGYTLMWFWLLLSWGFLLGSQPRGWAWAAACAAATWTIPVAVWPSLSLWLWALVSRWWAKADPARRRREVFRLLLAGAVYTLLVVILYSPILVKGQGGNLFRHPWAAALPEGQLGWASLATAREFGQAFLKDRNPMLLAVILTGLFSGMTLVRKRQNHVLLAVSLLIVPLASMAYLQHPAPVRALYYVIPFLYLIAADGWVGMFE